MERKQHADKEFLYREHIILGKPMSQIAKECGVSGDTIRRNMIKCNIKYWTTQYREKLSDTQIDRWLSYTVFKNYLQMKSEKS